MDNETGRKLRMDNETGKKFLFFYLNYFLKTNTLISQYSEDRPTWDTATG
jgi:hypothetical protein